MIDQHAASRARNCIVAGALGDALSGTLTGSVGPQGALFPASPSLSDDTWLTLATCEAIAREGGRVHPARVAGVFVEWLAQKRFRGAGSASLTALRDLSAGADWAMSGARAESAAAGAALRCAPLAFFLDSDDEKDRVVVRDVVRITHHSDEAYAGAVAVIAAIRHCLRSTGVPSDLAAEVLSNLPDTRLRERLDSIQRFAGDSAEAAEQFGVSGDVAEAVPLAVLIASRNPDTLEAALTEAASLGGGADTIAGLVGQMLGAAGCDVPAALLDALPERHAIDVVLQPFVQLVGGSVAQ